MIHTGHDELTRAIVEQMTRSKIERETRVEVVPPAVKELIENLNNRLARVEEFNAALVQEAMRTAKEPR